MFKNTNATQEPRFINPETLREGAGEPRPYSSTDDPLKAVRAAISRMESASMIELSEEYFGFPTCAHQGSTRSDCLRIIIRLVGEGGVASFLKSQQPALGDRTGAQLLQDDPVDLRRRLKWLEAQNDGFDEELVGDPDIEHYSRQRRKSQADRVLDILDELETGRGI